MKEIGEMSLERKKEIGEMEDYFYINGFDQSYKGWLLREKKISATYSRVLTQVHEMSSEKSEGDINEDIRDMLNNFEAKAEVEDNVAKSSHGPVSDVLGSGERIFFLCQIMGEY